MSSLAGRRSRALPIWILAAVLVLAGTLGQPGALIPGETLGLAPGAENVARAEDDAPRAAFAILQRRAGGLLAAHWDERSGIPTFIAGADGATPIPYTPTAAERGNPVAIARGFLDENRALFRLTGAAAELEAIPLEPDHQLGYAHVRLRQVYRGIPVFGRQLVVHLDPQERVMAVNGHFVPGIDVPTEPSIGREAAAAVALEDLIETQLEADERARVATEVLRDKTDLVVYVDEGGKATLAWRVTIMTRAPLGQWRYFVNARRPVVVGRFDSIAGAKQRRTHTAENSTDIPGRLIVQEGERSRDEVAQAAHDGAGRVYDYYFNTFKRDSVDGRGSPLVSTVHYGSDPQEAENAAWVGEAAQMIYGDGGRIFRPLPYGLDVVGHEFTHGVVESTADLVYEGQSGALNESYADVFGTLIAGSNWTIGSQVVKSPPYPLPYLRSLEDPNARGNYDPRNPIRGVGQPAHMREYANLPVSRRADNGGVHINSGIPNRAAFLVAQALGNQKMEQIYYRTLTQYLTPTANFLDAARATVRSATELYGAGDAEAVRGAFAQVGIDVNSGATAPTPPGAPAPGGPSTPRPSPDTPQPQPVPQGCTDLVTNGGFESETGWTQRSTAHTSIIDPELPHTGSRSAWLGGTDKEPVQYIFQDVTIPANATGVRLTYFRLIHRETSGIFGGLAGDADFNVLIADTSGKELGAVEELSSAQGDDTWREGGGDLSQFAGKTIRLVFHAENPRGNVSSFFVDDVALAACTTGAGPAAPSTGSQDLVYVQGKIANADTGRGVEGAQVVVLKPGVSASGAAADNRISADEALTRGTTDANGVYRTEAPVPRGQTFSVIVIASGFRTLVADNGMAVPANAPNPYTVNATVRRGR